MEASACYCALVGMGGNRGLGHKATVFDMVTTNLWCQVASGEGGQGRFLILDTGPADYVLLDGGGKIIIQ